jgi:hypothetical protein
MASTTIPLFFVSSGPSCTLSPPANQEDTPGLHGFKMGPEALKLKGLSSIGLGRIELLTVNKGVKNDPHLIPTQPGPKILRFLGHRLNQTSTMIERKTPQPQQKKKIRSLVVRSIIELTP